MLRSAPRSTTPDIPTIYPSDFVAATMYVLGEPFSFQGREYLYEPYNVDEPEILLLAGRQVEKSTTLGNKLLTYAYCYAGVRILYVSPSDRQTKTFSLERIRTPVIGSPVLSVESSLNMLSVYDPKFHNGSIIKLRSAYLTADRVRGERADIIGLDEYQDLLVENIPVIRECAFHANLRWKRFLYSGTPKTMGNPIQQLWEKSTMTELMFPCRRHGGKHAHTWFWFPITEDCIGKFGLVCPRCHQPINHLDPAASWVDTAPKKRERAVKGYHLPQPITPMAHEVSDEGRRAWDEILVKQERYPRGKFLNEVFGMSYDYGTQPLLQTDLVACQVPGWEMTNEQMSRMLRLSVTNDIFAGIDWCGENEFSYTVVTLSSYANSPSDERLFQFYSHRFEGKEVSRELQLERIFDLLRAYNVRFTVADYGMGQYQNQWLGSRLGESRYFPLQYIGKQQQPIVWRPKLQRFTGYKSALCTAYINAIKSGKIALPAWSAFHEPFGLDMLNVRGEYVEKRDEMMYVHGREATDDSFHAGLYSMVAALLGRPRPDILRVMLEEEVVDDFTAEHEQFIYG